MYYIFEFIQVALWMDKGEILNEILEALFRRQFILIKSGPSDYNN